MHVTEKFNYKILKRETAESGSRVYLTPGGNKVPSVTTVLSKTKDMSFLVEWKKRIGEDRAKEIVTRSINYGNAVHKNLEDYILEEKAPSGNVFVKHMTNQIIKKGLVNIDEVWGVEVALFAEGLYAGTTDLCGRHCNDDAIIDFKNSRSFRKEEWVEDYKLQVCAYGMAHDSMFGTKIRKGVIMLATQNGHYQEWIVEGKDYNKYCDMWAKRLEEYYNKYM